MIQHNHLVNLKEPVILDDANYEHSRHNSEPLQQKQQIECAPSEDSDQPGLPLSMLHLEAWVTMDSSFTYADREDSVQTELISRLIWFLS